MLKIFRLVRLFIEFPFVALPVDICFGQLDTTDRAVQCNRPFPEGQELNLILKKCLYTNWSTKNIFTWSWYQQLRF
jgi:hypothetical protein